MGDAMRERNLKKGTQTLNAKKNTEKETKANARRPSLNFLFATAGILVRHFNQNGTFQLSRHIDAIAAAYRTHRANRLGCERIRENYNFMQE